MIYFIECSGRVKIGFSVDPKTRLNKVAADAPFPCKLIGVVHGGKETEDEIQAKWKHLHCHREWFAASSDLIAWIAENAAAGVPKKRVLFKSGNERKPHSEMCGLAVKRGMKKEIARQCGLMPSAVAQWRQVPAEYCSIVSRITGHDLQVLRPDIFSHMSGSVQ